jgi:hypothetical protein
MGLARNTLLFFHGEYAGIHGEWQERGQPKPQRGPCDVTLVILRGETHWRQPSQYKNPWGIELLPQLHLDYHNLCWNEELCHWHPRIYN